VKKVTTTQEQIAGRQIASIPLGLREHVLGTEGELLRLNNSYNATVDRISLGAPTPAV